MFSNTLIAFTQPATRWFGKPLKLLMAGLGLLGAGLSVAASSEGNTHPTLRALSGVSPVDHLQAATTALVVIDFQNEYFTGKLPIPDGIQALDNARRLINFADQSGIPVFHVQHVAPKDSPLFAEGSHEAQFHPLMQPRAQDQHVQKSTVSVFASTDLDSQLKARGIKTVILAGLMTHACVAGAARDATPLGYNVVVAADASATRAITRFDGNSVTSQQLHQAALTEIEDTFGDVLSTDRITALSLR
ncbi:Isochorismatase hydrolase [Pseudomonas coronafaciens pv. atropurpurea]|uniref:cysteine hydrolase family protein n=1 Tax=Pseudomonas coronafaciens TaxID=53409 RepID=UPI0006D5F5BD|nr:cysteine hydrolase family protein [Pseudomonas coronafaciens]KPW32005.1 Isochorismatase hydrolase [Pseudomonas coronafaciens pv. atropurpurea]RMT59539.1 Isochorismatase hydrolase [Pseudomonas coronafaciens pv. atropurpurea]